MLIPLPRLASAFIAPACHAWSNTIDNVFSERFKGNLTLLIAMGKIFEFILIVPLVLWFKPHLGLPPRLMLLLVLIVIIDFGYIYPYFWALRHTDTSVVVALFSFGKILLPVLSWLFLRERLTLGQYAGFFLVILAGLLLTFDWRKFHLNAAAGCMLLVSLLLSSQAILTKYILLQGVTWQSVTVWSMALEGLIGSCILLALPRHAITLWRGMDGVTKSLFFAEAVITMTGNIGSILALSLLPVSIAKALSSTQHLFVTLNAKLFHPIWPRYFKERSTNMSPITKFAGLLMTTFGAILASGYLF